MGYLTPAVHTLPLDLHLGQGPSLPLLGPIYRVVLPCQEVIVVTVGHPPIRPCITAAFPQHLHPPQLVRSDKLLDLFLSSHIRTGTPS